MHEWDCLRGQLPGMEADGEKGTCSRPHSLSSMAPAGGVYSSSLLALPMFSCNR